MLDLLILSVVLLPIASLAVGRLIYMIMHDNLPFGAMAKFREMTLHWGEWRELFDCPFCLSIWISFAVLMPLYLMHSTPEFLLKAYIWFVTSMAVSGGGVLVYKWLGNEITS